MSRKSRAIHPSVRALAQRMARGTDPQGAHVAHTILDGMVEKDGESAQTYLAPNDITEPTTSFIGSTVAPGRMSLIFAQPAKNSERS